VDGRALRERDQDEHGRIVTLIDEMSELGMDFGCAERVSVNVSAQAGGSSRLINDALYYDKARSRSHQSAAFSSSRVSEHDICAEELDRERRQHGACKDRSTVSVCYIYVDQLCDMKMLKPVRPFAAAWGKLC
jgi:hypothetical protein